MIGITVFRDSIFKIFDTKTFFGNIFQKKSSLSDADW